VKEVKAIIKPFKLDDVKEALKKIGIDGLTVCEAKGFGTQKGNTELYQGREYVVEWVPKIMLVTVVPDEKVSEAVRAIVDSAKSGRVGDGRVIVTHVEQFWNIRTSRYELLRSSIT